MGEGISVPRNEEIYSSNGAIGLWAIDLWLTAGRRIRLRTGKIMTGATLRPRSQQRGGKAEHPLRADSAYDTAWEAGETPPRRCNEYLTSRQLTASECRKGAGQ